eukprot:2751983-Pyramimonas_sp.AAC.2
MEYVMRGSCPEWPAALEGALHAPRKEAGGIGGGAACAEERVDHCPRQMRRVSCEFVNKLRNAIRSSD